MAYIQCLRTIRCQVFHTYVFVLLNMTTTGTATCAILRQP